MMNKEQQGIEYVYALVDMCQRGGGCCGGGGGGTYRAVVLRKTMGQAFTSKPTMANQNKETKNKRVYFVRY